MPTRDQTPDAVRAGVERAALAAAFTASLTADWDELRGALTVLDEHQLHRLVHAGQRLTRGARAALRTPAALTGIALPAEEDPRDL